MWFGIAKFDFIQNRHVSDQILHLKLFSSWHPAWPCDEVGVGYIWHFRLSIFLKVYQLFKSTFLIQLYGIELPLMLGHRQTVLSQGSFCICAQPMRDDNVASHWQSFYKERSLFLIKLRDIFTYPCHISNTLVLETPALKRSAHHFCIVWPKLDLVYVLWKQITGIFCKFTQCYTTCKMVRNLWLMILHCGSWVKMYILWKWYEYASRWKHTYLNMYVMLG